MANNKRVRCQSGIMGWQGRLRDQYTSIEPFRCYAEMYGLHLRLGFKSVEEAWETNPLIQGSIDPSDYSRVK